MATARRKSLVEIQVQREYQNFKIVNNTLYTADDYFISMDFLTSKGYRITSRGKLMRKVTRGNGKMIEYKDSPRELQIIERLQNTINAESTRSHQFAEFRPDLGWMSKKII
eukprot:NODE_9_length_64580_cov_1.431941.p53 type:complete len:111 gc:universal NODE_9_length_64580_cov_1.431941:21347-21679(+)